MFVGIFILLCVEYADAFNLYLGKELSPFAEERGVTDTCMSALNQTVNCNDEFLPRVMLLEQLEWESSNLTSGCSSECASGLQGWVDNVNSACIDNILRQDGRLIRPETIPLMFQHQYELACMDGGDSGWCWIDSMSWVGSDIKRYAPDLCATGHSEWDNDLCFEEGFDPMVIEEDDKRLSSLYDKELVCSDCFLRILTHRLESPMLDNSSHASYLLDQHQELQTYCSTDIPVTTSSQKLMVGTMPLPTPTTSGSTTVPSASPTCDGQIINPPENPMDCDMVSEKYNVTTGDLTVLTGDWSCFISSPICAPLSCKIEQIGWGETCESLRESISSPERNATMTQFSTWNWRLIGPCDNVRGDQYICAGPPGGEYIAPPPVYAPTGTSEYYTTAQPALPTSDGTISNCGKYHGIKKSDTCNTICLRYGITLSEFQDLNTQINADCTNLWLGYSYCVAEVTPPPLSTNGLCGPKNGHAICDGTEFGDCCSYYGFCGNGSQYCSPGNCYSGACTGSPEGITEDGTCGPDHNDWLCGESQWGKCCSIYGYCGNSEDHCGLGMCYSGACETDNGGQSVDGSCGPNLAGNKTCAGTQFGKCCNNAGYCGSTEEFCSAENCYSGECLS